MVLDAMVFRSMVLDTMVFWSMVLDVMAFRSMVLDASACINMYCNIKRNIMKNQACSPSFGIQGKSLCICVLCSRIFYFSCDLEFVCR